MVDTHCGIVDIARKEVQLIVVQCNEPLYNADVHSFVAYLTGQGEAQSILTKYQTLGISPAIVTQIVSVKKSLFLTTLSTLLAMLGMSPCPSLPSLPQSSSFPRLSSQRRRKRERERERERGRERERVVNGGGLS